MRYLVLTLGTPASGKSTWIDKNGLRGYTLEPDDLRLKIKSPVLTLDGEYTISQRYDRQVWKMLFDILEERMLKGEFTVIDATHSSTKMLNAYKDLIKKYRYRVLVVDFRNIDLETILERNKNRLPEYKKVPEMAIKNIYERCKTLEIPNKYEVISSEDGEFQKWKEEKEKLYDFSEYPKINIFGDIHGCFDELMALRNQMGITENDYNIFAGDYFDRFRNVDELIQLFEFLESLDPKKNMFLMGNHEKWFMLYSEWVELNNAKDESKLDSIKEKINTLKERIKQLDPEDINQRDQLIKKLRKLENKLENTKRNIIVAQKEYDEKIRNVIPKDTRQTFFELTKAFGEKRVKMFGTRLAQLAYFKYHDKTILVNHAGITSLPNVLMSSSEFMYGPGKYGDEEEIAQFWTEKYPDIIQVFGHRNIYNIDTKQGNCYLINGNAELGGAEGKLRAISILPNEIKIFEQASFKERNNMFPEWEKEILERKLKESKEMVDELGIIEASKRHRGIQVNLANEYQKIYSINFKSSVFKSGTFDALSIHARGLFVQKIEGEKND